MNVQQAVSLSPFHPAPPNQKQVDSCRKKNKLTYLIAVQQSEETMLRAHSSRQKPRLSIYHCPACGWWHLTSRR